VSDQRKSSQIVLGVLPIVVGLAFAWLGVRDLRTGHAIGLGIFDFFMTAVCVGFGLLFLRRRENQEMWREAGILIVLGGTSLKDGIQGVKGGDISLEVAMSFVILGFCILLVILVFKSRRDRLGPRSE